MRWTYETLSDPHILHFENVSSRSRGAVQRGCRGASLVSALRKPVSRSATRSLCLGCHGFGLRNLENSYQTEKSAQCGDRASRSNQAKDPERSAPSRWISPVRCPACSAKAQRRKHGPIYPYKIQRIEPSSKRRVPTPSPPKHASPLRPKQAAKPRAKYEKA